MSCTAIIVAAGKSERFGGDLPKVFVEVAGKPVLAWTIARFDQAPSIDNILLVVAEDYMPLAMTVVDTFGSHKAGKIVSGGATRQESVKCGLEAVPHSAELVAIHDGARPLVAVADIEAVVRAAGETGAAILAAQCTDTLKRVKDKVIDVTLSKEDHYLAQTPQIFRRELILQAHRQTGMRNAVDDAVLVEEQGVKVTVVEPTSVNFKITYAHHLRMAQVILEQSS